MSYTALKDKLTETEKNRIIAIYLNTTGGETDWQKATTEFGAASIDSMKVSMRTTLKKAATTDTASTEDGCTAQNTPKKTPKRKAVAPPTPTNEEGQVEAPKRKRGRPSKKDTTKAKTTTVKAEAEAEEDEEV